jgi:hypothetical protein
LTVASGDTFDPFVFVNFEWATVTACKEDYAGTPLADWTINLLDDGDVELEDKVTDGTGCVEFTIMQPGDYSLTEDLKPGWFQIEPASGSFDVPATSGYQNTFTFINGYPEIKIDKEISDNYDEGTGTGDWYDSVEVIVGTKLYYRFTVENTGNVPLYDVTVTDPTLGALLDDDVDDVFCTYAELAPGEQVVCGPFGPVPAEFTGEDETSCNTATAEGIYDDPLAVSDSDEACYTALYWAFTPGFWKNHWGNPERPNQNDAWQYTAYDPYGEFASRLCAPDAFWAACDEFPENYDQTVMLLDALSLQGGSDLIGASEILLRAGTASLLNASFHETLDVAGHPAATIVIGDPCELQGPGGICYFPYATETIIEKVNAALGGTRAEMLTLAAELDGYNNGIETIDWDW